MAVHLFDIAQPFVMLSPLGPLALGARPPGGEAGNRLAALAAAVGLLLDHAGAMALTGLLTGLDDLAVAIAILPDHAATPALGRLVAHRVFVTTGLRCAFAAVRTILPLTMRLIC